MDIDPHTSGGAERLLEIGRNLTANLDLESLLQQITGAARDLTDAKYAALGVLSPARDSLDRFITLGIEAEERKAIGELPRGRGVLGLLIDDPRPLRLSRLSDHPSAFGFPDQHPPMNSFLGVPIMIDGTAYGFLYLTDKTSGDFDSVDEASVVTLAAWAAIAIQNARSVRDDRLRAAIDGSENERRRWARELHDETLQSLGALHVLLASALRKGDKASLESAAKDGAEQVRIEISNLRSLITELRPAALDELGLAAALASLSRRMSSLSDVDVDLTGDLELLDDLREDLQVTVYRIVQEAMSNALKHATPTRINVRVDCNATSVQASVHDDGHGFDCDAPSAGFGIVGMRERVTLAGGSLTINSSESDGTVVSATMPTAASTP